MLGGTRRVCCAVLWLVVVTTTIQSATATLDVATEYQTIEGFGAHGAMDVWWRNGPFYTPQFLDLVVDDLGLTINRQLFGDINTGQFDQSRREPFLKALKAKADQSSEPMRFIVTVQSPAPEFKSNNSFVDGGTLLPQYYDDFAHRVVAHIDEWQAAGLDVYGLSLQNEPAFAEPYGSCVYTPEQYRDMVKVVGPIVHESYPDVKLFGAEHMLSNWGTFEGPLMADPESRPQMWALAVHGYSDGIHPDPASKSGILWGRAKRNCESVGKNLWMSETSGYNDEWGDGGAQELAASIFAALKYGHASAWVWWQLSEPGGSVYALMEEGTPGKRYYASKQFYRFIRPGAAMVACTCDDADVLTVAFHHAQQQTMTVVVLNPTGSAKTMAIAGGGPLTYTAYRTTASENCTDIGTVQANAVPLPPNSVTTLYAAGYATDAHAGAARARMAAPTSSAQVSVYSLDGRLVPAGAAPKRMAGGVRLMRNATGEVCAAPVGLQTR